MPQRQKRQGRVEVSVLCISTTSFLFLFTIFKFNLLTLKIETSYSPISPAPPQLPSLGLPPPSPIYSVSTTSFTNFFLCIFPNSQGILYVCVCACSVVSDTLWSYGLKPACSSVHRILQATILEWAVISFSRGSTQPRDQTCVSYISCVITDPAENTYTHIKMHIFWCLLTYCFFPIKTRIGKPFC